MHLAKEALCDIFKATYLFMTPSGLPIQIC